MSCFSCGPGDRHKKGQEVPESNSAPVTPPLSPIVLPTTGKVSDHFQLPSDLQIRHLRKYQTLISSATTSSNDAKRIDKVRMALITGKSSHNDKKKNQNHIGETHGIDVEIKNCDQAEDLTAQMAQLSLQSRPITEDNSLYMPNQQEDIILNRYQPQIIEKYTAPLVIPIGTTIGFPTFPDKSTPPIITTRAIHVNPITIPSQNEPTPSQKQFNSLPPVQQQKIKAFINAIQAIDQAKSIVVVMGAGLSVSAGIPDFRSSNGLYTLLKGVDLSHGAAQFKLDPIRFPPEQLLKLQKGFRPEQLFDIEMFRLNPIPFYTFYYQMDLVGDVIRPTFTHQFIKILQDRGKLRRVYTQNIDNLEAKAGIENYIPCHGNDMNFYCLDCGLTVKTKFLQPWLESRQIPICNLIRHFLYNQYYTKAEKLEQSGVDTTAGHSDQVPGATQNLLDWYQGEKYGSCFGLWKPTITFFGEELPKNFFTTLELDKTRADLILVLGTSLQVAPVSRIPMGLSENMGKLGQRRVNRIFTNMGDDTNSIPASTTAVTTNYLDYSITQIRSPSLTTHLPEDTQVELSRLPFEKERNPVNIRRVSTNYFLEQYLPILSRHNPDQVHIEQLTQNLAHVPIISINRDALLPLSMYEATHTEKGLETAVRYAFDKEYQVVPLDHSGNISNASLENIKPRGPEIDDLSDGDYDEWISSDGKEMKKTKNKPDIVGTESSYLQRLDYEFLGNADDVCQFIVKTLGW